MSEGARRPACAGTLLLALLLAACAPTQMIRLQVEPDASQLYVDGELVEGRPGAIELRADRDHVLFFKSPGHRPERVVILSVPGQPSPRLEPAQVDVRLRRLSPGGRDVRIEPVIPDALD